MKKIIILLILLSITTFKPHLINTKDEKKESLKSTNHSDTIIDTIQINNQNLILIFKQNQINCLLSLKGDTIVRSENYYQEAKFIDIDKDGFKDIRIFIISNTPNQCENYLYDKNKKSYKLLENCYNDIQKIKGTDLYYSYNATGCADNNWESYLSKIENNKLLNYGYIYGDGCEDEDNPLVKIYKINQNKEFKFLEQLHYKDFITNLNDKWTFIESYWRENSEKFE